MEGVKPENVDVRSNEDVDFHHNLVLNSFPQKLEDLLRELKFSLFVGEYSESLKKVLTDTRTDTQTEPRMVVEVDNLIKNNNISK